MTNQKDRVALVTGANKGLGLEVCRQLARAGARVILAARDEDKGQRAARELEAQGLAVTFRKLDVRSEEDVNAAAEWIERSFKRLDILVNNAGIFEGEGTWDTGLDAIRSSLETNTLAPFLLCQKLVPLMAKNRYGRVVNVSSGMGQLHEMNGGYPAYRISKTALNAVTRIFAEDAMEAGGPGIKINSACPGWVKTDMGGEDAELTVEQGADTITWLATLPEDGPTGGFFRERKPIQW